MFDPVCDDCLYAGNSNCVPHTSPAPPPGSYTKLPTPIPVQIADPLHPWNRERALKKTWANTSHVGTKEVGGTV